MELFNIRNILLLVVVMIGFHFYQSSRDEAFVPTEGIPYDTTVLAFGDSLTQGYGVEPSMSYPSQLSSLLHVKVINEGISGELSDEGLRRLGGLLEKHTPQIVLLCHGANDILRRKDLTKTKANLLKMVTMAQEKGIFVVLIGVPTYEILTFETASFYKEVAHEKNIPLEEEALEEILGKPELKSDNVHPNADGYALMARRIAHVLNEYYIPNP